MNRRSFLQSACCVAIGAPTRTKGKDFDVRSYGAVGDGTALDTAAIQRTIQVAAASGSGARVLLGGGKRYLTGALTLRSGIDFHLADDAQLVASTNPDDYSRDHGAILNADQVTDLKISGTGHIDGQAMKFMTTYSQKDERWEPKHFHPPDVLTTWLQGRRDQRNLVRSCSTVGTSSAWLRTCSC